MNPAIVGLLVGRSEDAARDRSGRAVIIVGGEVGEWEVCICVCVSLSLSLSFPSRSLAGSDFLLQYLT